jgi:hypothetical protein
MPLKDLLKQSPETFPISDEDELSVNLWTNEFIFEVRYAPNARILDHRGKWAELISNHMGFKHWQIIENRIDVFSEDQKSRAFVGHDRAGYVLIDSPGKRYFQGQTEKLLRYLFRLTEFGGRLKTERIGVRCRFGVRYDGTFDELCERTASQYISIPQSTRAAFGESARLKDIGIALNYADEMGRFNTNCGPMTKAELAQFFQRDTENPPPEVGFYFDIDYFVRPKVEMMGIEIIHKVMRFSDQSVKRFQSVLEILNGDTLDRKAPIER